MQTSETRIINQCTYTPIKHKEGDNSTNQQPFVKQAILATVFDDPELSKIILEHVISLKTDDEWPYPHETRLNLANAVAAMWKGDFATSITTLRDIEIDHVAHFAREALNVERLLLDKAQQDLNDTVLSVSQNAEKDIECVSVLQKEMAAMRNSIVSEIKSIITSPTIKASQLNPEIQDNESAANTRITSNIIIEPSQNLSFNIPVQTVITSDLIRAEMNKRVPQSVQLLEKIDVITSQKPLKAIPVAMQKVTVKLEHTAEKIQTLETLLKNIKIEPVGYLHLERLQFTPLGYEKGDLVYSLPMLPGEMVRLSHREWSRTETEYTKLIETELETAAEEALSEKSEITQSSNTQQQHSSAFNTSTTASGGYGSFNISTSVGYNSSDSESQSRQYAMKHSQEITKKATSRSKKDSKISFKVATAYEIEDQQYREITNPLKRAVRYDFHRLMKKWRIDLYRYDIRLTYDIVIPEPGSYLLRKYILLNAINEELAKLNVLPFSVKNISREVQPTTSSQAGGLAPSTVHVRAPPAPDTTSVQQSTIWIDLASQYGVSLDSPPEEYITLTFSAKETYSNSQNQGTGQILIEIPDGYEIIEMKVSRILANSYYNYDVWEPVYDEDGKKVGSRWGQINSNEAENKSRLLLRGQNKGNVFSWQYSYEWAQNRDTYRRMATFPFALVPDRSYAPIEGTNMSLYIDVTCKLTSLAFKEWQMQCYERLVDAAKVKHENKQARLQQIRNTLLEELNREDALILRKIEREELMKGMLRWLLGPKFRFYPQNQAGLKLPQLQLPTIDLSGVDVSSLEDVAIQYYDPITQSVKEEYRASALQYGELIKFLHQAIEWENINYVLYPYFWTYPDKKRWDFKQSLYHNDYVHRSFLRAGAARVVLTIRPGFEPDFLSLMEGCLEGLLPPDHQYMTVADELKAVATTNYPYTQDANTEKEEHLFTWENVPGSDEGWLKRCLRQSFYVSWAEGHIFTGDNGNPVEIEPDISKSDDENTITISIHHDPQPQEPSCAKIEGLVELVLVRDDEGVESVILKITNGKIYHLKVRVENNLHRVYREQNLVDTWYEFTPTGALDVEVGNISDVLGA